VREVKANKEQEWLLSDDDFIDSVLVDEESITHLQDVCEVRLLSAASTQPWYCSVMVGAKTNVVNFKVDSGADVSVISDAQFRALEPRPQWKKPRRILRAANNEPLSAVAVFRAPLRFRDVTVHDNVYVIKGLRTCLLSRHMCHMLRILTFNGDEVSAVASRPLADADSVEKVADPVMVLISDLPPLVAKRRTSGPKQLVGSFNPRIQYGSLFSGIGSLKVSYKIRLKKGVTPRAETASYRVPLKRQEAAKRKLQVMLQDGVLSRVTHPTPWCSRMVLATKPRDPKDFRITADLVELNKAVVRDRIILPSVNESLAKMGGARVFSKLDCKDSFWQIELDPDCRELTTFITPWGRFCYNRLTMGL
jgi:hypothetical protein